MSETPARSASDEATQAGRGVIYIGLAKLYFILAGAIIEFRLPAMLASSVFGAYAVVASAVSPLNNVLVTGTIQAVSRFTAQTPGQARAIQAAGLRMHLVLGLPLAIAFMAGAPLTAYLLHDTSKIGPLILAGGIVAGYSFYSVFVGTANGTRAFHKQAALDVCFATLRALGILGLAAAGFGVYGAVGGWVGAVVLILGIAALVVGVPRAAGAYSARPLMSFFANVAVYLVLLNLIMFADVYLLKRLVTEWYLSSADPATSAALAASGLVPAQAADAQVGYYRAVQNLARLSYQAIIAGMFVIFPLVSRSTFDRDRAATQRYVRTIMRYSLIFATAIAVVMAANPEPMLDLLYPLEYAQLGASALIALALGNVGFCLFAIAGTILNGAGMTRQAIQAAAVTLVLSVAANALLIPRAEPGASVLLSAAAATGGAMVLGALFGGVLLHKHLGAFIPWRTPARVLVAVAVGLGVGRLVQLEGPLMTLVEAALVGLSYLLALVITRELSGRDVAALTSLAGRRKPAAGDPGAST